MSRYIARRMLLMLLVIAGMSIITFTLSRLVPGNPARLLAGPHARQEQVDALAERYRRLMVRSWSNTWSIWVGFCGEISVSL